LARVIANTFGLPSAARISRSITSWFDAGEVLAG
jgi:hypothetical protein